LIFHYDGKGIGAFLGDAIRDIVGSVIFNVHADNWLSLISSASGVLRAGYPGPLKHIAELSTNFPEANTGFDIIASRSVPTALENRPASISAYMCIKY
jgi:hypothetical protein